MNAPMLFGILIGMLCYWRWRNLYYTRLAIRHRFAMFRLRDRLRRAAIEGVVDKKSLAFAFLDHSLCFSIWKAEHHNLFTYWFMSKGDPQGVIDNRLKMEHLVDAFKAEKEALAILLEFRWKTREYFLRKHYFLGLFTGIVIFWKGFTQRINNAADALASAVIVSSEQDSYYGLQRLAR